MSGSVKKGTGRESKAKLTPALLSAYLAVFGHWLRSSLKILDLEEISVDYDNRIISNKFFSLHSLKNNTSILLLQKN